jgi:hypothetical protein
MKKLMILSLGAGALMFTACDRTHTGTTTDTTTGTANTTVDRSATTTHGGMHGTDQDAMYRERATRTSGQMATDLQLDDNARTRTEEIHYNRAQRRADVQQRYASDQARLDQEMRTIDEENDRDLRSVLTEDQYRNYEQNRDTYADRDNYELNQSGMDRRGGMDTENQMQNQQGTMEQQGTNQQQGTQQRDTSVDHQNRPGHPKVSPNDKPQHEVHSGSDGTTPSTQRNQQTQGTNQNRR